jgi:hypothetical protein
MAASPFPHLVLENLFNPALLDLVAEEFDAQPAARCSGRRWVRRPSCISTSSIRAGSSTGFHP